MNAAQMQTCTVRLDLAYLGTSFHGFAENPGVRTVAGDLRTALERVLGTPIKLAIAGRTDAGVHAVAQVVSFQMDKDRIAGLAGKLNKMLAPAIAVMDIREVAADFDARHSAKSRSYQYTICNAAAPDPLQAHCQWHLSEPLDLPAMNAAAAHLVGEHDFSSFCRQTNPPTSLRRRVLHANWTQDSVNETDRGVNPETDRLLTLQITAWAFCHQMVRSIVGVCVAVGRGRRHADEVPEILASTNRNAIGKVAPPHGLVLVDVCY